jgi:kynurenine formamidase
MRKVQAILAAGLGALLLAPIPGISSTAQSIALGRIIDLTHAFDEQTPYWPTAGGFELRSDFHGHTEKGYYYASNTFSASEHGGTHLDAPIHFAENGQTADAIPLTSLIGSAVVIDVSPKALADSDYQVSVQDLSAFEAEHGDIADGAIVLLHTGYDRFWPDRERYMGTAERGDAAVAQLHFPGLHPDAARWLVENRNISAIGLDTPSIDYGQSTHFESHQVLFAKDIPAFENVANLGQLPPTGAFVIALPMKIRGGSGGPLRIIAVLAD